MNGNTKTYVVVGLLATAAGAVIGAVVGNDKLRKSASDQIKALYQKDQND